MKTLGQYILELIGLKYRIEFVKDFYNVNRINLFLEREGILYSETFMLPDDHINDEKLIKYISIAVKNINTNIEENLK